LLVGVVITPQLARKGSGRLAMIDHCTFNGRLRSPSSAARRRWSIKSAKADKVKLSASTMPTRKGARVAEALGAANLEAQAG
jgi:hypothetical protein